MGTTLWKTVVNFIIVPTFMTRVMLPVESSSSFITNVITSSTSNTASSRHAQNLFPFSTRKTPSRVCASHKHTLLHMNPFSTEAMVSSSGVFHKDVLDGVNKLYPPGELSRRNAASRTDGYWAYISEGEEPPSTLTYGEFDFLFFAELIDKALFHHEMSRGEDSLTLEDMTFTDIGSGTGRLVMGAAALHPKLKLCKGLELLPGIHKVAEKTLELCVMGENHRCLSFSSSSGTEDTFPLAPIVFSRGSFDDPYEYIGDSDIIFVFSTCFTAEMMNSLSDAIGRQCKPGTIVITTEYKLQGSGTIDPSLNDPNLSHGQYRIDLIDSVDGNCWLVGGISTAHIHRVMQSLWDGSGPKEKPKEFEEVPKELSFEDFLKSH
jgi:Histone methylation protein DOT1.